MYRSVCVTKMPPIYIFGFGDGSLLALQYSLKNVAMLQPKTLADFLNSLPVSLSNLATVQQVLRKLKLT